MNIALPHFGRKSLQTFRLNMQNLYYVVIFAGNSNGTIHIFHITEDWDEVLQVERKRVHEKAITDIATSTGDRLLATADDAGALSLWKLEQQLGPVNTFPSYE
jgi:WD40 repeat protein